MRIILFIFFYFLSVHSYAQFDLSYGTSLRSYPGVGGDANLELGYNQVLYGTPGSKESILSGLIRPSIKGSSSGVVSNYDSRLSFYPLSFIAFGAGHQEYTSEYTDFSYYDCKEVRCTGKIKKDYSFGKIALAAGDFITTFFYKEFRNTYSDDELLNQPVAEYQYALEVAPKNESEVERSYFIGHKFGDDYFGILTVHQQFLESKKDYRLNIAVYQTKLSVFKTTFGLGSLQSSDTKPGAVIILRMTHQVLPELTLF
jgi:hypothetical protein